jgi:tyrosyl-tRNA synthetase
MESGSAVGLHELMYPLMQGYDSVAVRSDLELGGTDQLFNLMFGRDMQRESGMAPQDVLTMPLLEGLDGVQKMGKSLGNWVGIDEPPHEQFGKLMSIPDAAVPQYARLTTDLPPDEAERVAAAAAEGGPAANRAKRRMARSVVALYHGAEAAEAAEARFDRQFRDRELPEDVPERVLTGDDPVHLPALLVELGFAASTSAGRRLVDDGAVRVDGERLPAKRYDAPRDELAGHVLTAGRRRLVRLTG